MTQDTQKYHRYRRGQIVLVDFSPSIGSEMRGKHFAIVLTKKDSPNNGVITVIPLSSKNKPYYLNIGNIVKNQIYPYLQKSCDEFLSIIEKVNKENIHKLNIEDVKKIEKNLNDFINISNMYIEKDKCSYALVQNITTISKKRIKKPVNQYDPIRNLIIDSLILDLIDNKIKELFLK